MGPLDSNFLLSDSKYKSGSRPGFWAIAPLQWE